MSTTLTVVILKNTDGSIHITSAGTTSYVCDIPNDTHQVPRIAQAIKSLAEVELSVTS